MTDFGARPGHRFVDRGDPSGYDLTLANFQTDGSLHDISFATWVPDGALAAYLLLQIRAAVLPHYVYFKKKGNTNYHNRLILRGIRTDKYVVGNGFVFLDSARKAQYMTTSMTFIAIDVVIAGWLI